MPDQDLEVDELVAGLMEPATGQRKIRSDCWLLLVKWNRITPTKERYEEYVRDPKGFVRRLNESLRTGP